MPHFNKYRFEKFSFSLNNILSYLYRILYALFYYSLYKKLSVVVNDIKKNKSDLTKLGFSSEEKIQIGNFWIQEFSSAIAFNTNLTKLDLADSKIGIAGIKALSTVLTYDNSSIIQLSLRGNNIGKSGAEEFSKVLLHNKSIKKLNLSHNQFGDFGSEILAHALIDNTSITELDLAYNNICEFGAKAIVQALKYNIKLKSLNLASNELKKSGSEAFAEVLSENNTLTSLNLSWNSIGSQGAKILIEELVDNNALTELNLSNNVIGLLGAKAFLQSLPTNTSLKILKLSSCQIENEGTLTIIDSLSKNTTLTQLTLDSNDVKDGVGALIKIIEKNKPPLLSLDLSNSIKHEDDRAKIRSQLMKGHNTTLIELKLFAKEVTFLDGNIQFINGKIKAHWDAAQPALKQGDYSKVIVELNNAKQLLKQLKPLKGVNSIQKDINRKIKIDFAQAQKKIFEIMPPSVNRNTSSSRQLAHSKISKQGIKQVNNFHIEEPIVLGFILTLTFVLIVEEMLNKIENFIPKRWVIFFFIASSLGLFLHIRHSYQNVASQLKIAIQKEPIKRKTQI